MLKTPYRPPRSSPRRSTRSSPPRPSRSSPPRSTRSSPPRPSRSSPPRSTRSSSLPSRETKRTNYVSTTSLSNIPFELLEQIAYSPRLSTQNIASMRQTDKKMHNSVTPRNTTRAASKIAEAGRVMQFKKNKLEWKVLFHLVGLLGHDIEAYSKRFHVQTADLNEAQKRAIIRQLINHHMQLLANKSIVIPWENILGGSRLGIGKFYTGQYVPLRQLA